MTQQPPNDVYPDRPETWPGFVPMVIAHDVAMARDRSTAVVGGISPFHWGMVGIKDFHELPQGQFGSARASALAAIDRHYHSDALIVADLSNEPSYGEYLYETFGPRVIGVHISRHGDGSKFERRPVGRGALLVYTVGRTFLIDHYHNLLATDMVRLTEGPDSRRAYAQLENLKMELRDTGKVYTCLPGQHDDLAISCCMLAWACRHPHVPHWKTNAFADRVPRQKPREFNWGAFT
jgi:hypothetical protein